MSINFPPSFHSGSGVDEKSRERKKNKEYITRRIDPPPPPPSGRYRFTDSCNFYTLERCGHDAHKRLKHVRAFIDRSTSSLPLPPSMHREPTVRNAGLWVFITRATFGRRFSPPYLCREWGTTTRFRFGGGKAARQLGGRRERKKKKERKKTREIRSVTSPRLASKIRVAQFRPLDRFETNRGEKNSTVKMHNKCETKLTPLTKGFIET